MSVVRAIELSVTPGMAATPALVGLDIDIDARSTIAVVGPSGSGKSTLARALVGLEPRMTGSLVHRDVELVGAPPRKWRALRQEIALCWQDASSALDPRLTIRGSLAEARRLAALAPLTDEGIEKLLDRFALSLAVCERRPEQLSGGQRQRAALARAMATEPRAIIADEVTSALDRVVAMQITKHLATLAASGIALIVITHDLSLLPGLVDQVVVLDRGRVVERGESGELLERPHHPVTRALVNAVPKLRRTV